MVCTKSLYHGPSRSRILDQSSLDSYHQKKGGRFSIICPAVRPPTITSSVPQYSLPLGHPPFLTDMCDYTQVQYKCNHLRYVVRAWCTRYQETHKRCPANIVAMQVHSSYPSLCPSNVRDREYRLDENCGLSFFIPVVLSMF